jgi:hypothetical protein
MKTFTYALITFSVLNLAGVLAVHGRVTGLQLALQAINTGLFSVASIATASAITGNKPVVIAMTIVLLLAIYPCDLQQFAHALTPIGVGLVVGTGVRAAIKKPEVSDAS